jgi:antitoxin (DNA-binding transcriptional repressor) of toxin-antitoxin stability system
MVVTASELRQNIYRLLDEVLETGVPLEIERKGRRLRIVAEDQPSKLDRLVPHPDALVGDPEDFVHIDWSHEWRP